MIEAFLVLVAISCVPVMLFGKPVYILMQQKKAKKALSDNMVRFDDVYKFEILPECSR